MCAPQGLSVPLALIGASEDVLAAEEAVTVPLTTVELERAGSFRRQSDRRDFIAAHVLVRLCAGRLLGIEAHRLSVTQRCPTCRAPHGKPTIDQYPGLYVSLSHSKGVVAAISGFDPMGIDVERVVAPRVKVGELDSVLAPREIEALTRAPNYQLAFMRQWVRKEALVKIGAATLGTLSSIDLAGLPFDEPGGSSNERIFHWNGWCLLDWTDTRHQAIGTVVSVQRPDLEVLLKGSFQRLG